MDKIIFNVAELADCYALDTLYKYLIEKDPEIRKDIVFHLDHYSNETLPSDFLEDKQVIDFAPNNSFIVGAYSDISDFSKFLRYLEVDISILKNSAIPKEPQHKQKLRKKYNIKSNLPVIVLGFSNLQNLFNLKSKYLFYLILKF